MEIKIPEYIIKELYDINWFVNCGKSIINNGTVQAKNAAQVLKTINSDKWSNMVLDYSNDVTAQLCKRQINGSGNEYGKWNDLVSDFKTNHINILKEKWQVALEKYGLNNESVISDVSMNILTIAVVNAYKDIAEISDFFIELFQIYKDGYLPCGWKGKKNDGNIIVF